MRIVYYVLLLILAFPVRAEAYLDPASGNALVSFLVAILGSTVFFFKSFFYKFFSKNAPTIEKVKISQCSGVPILFSEGGVYWSTFRPIVKELIYRKVHFRYVTLDLYDPGLTIDSEYMDSRRFSPNSWGFSRIAKLKGPLLLSTTPNIGCELYPMKRPAGVQKMVHVFHALLDVSCYHKGSLDYYDTVLMVANHQIAPLRLVEKARGLVAKELIDVGLPYLDELFHQRKCAPRNEEEGAQKTVLVAPSWGPKGCFSYYGTEFVRTLAKNGYRIIIRLHPQSKIHEPALVELWEKETGGISNILWDRNLNGTEAMSKADILISDTSSIRFDFAFLYMKPVITLQIPQERLSEYEGDYMDQTWADSVAGELGIVLSPKEIENIVGAVDATLGKVTEDRLRALRDKYVSNLGKSASVIADYIVAATKESHMSPGERELRDEIEWLKRKVKELSLRIDKQAGS